MKIATKAKRHVDSHNRMGRAPDEAEARAAELSGDTLANTALLADLARRDAEMTVVVQAHLARLEQALVRVDRLLRISQPPKSGKLGVRWWVVNGRDKIRHPLLVRWKQVKGGKWRSTKVAQVRQYDIDRNGTSALNAGDTLKLAQLAVRLIKGYESWIAKLRKLELELNKGDAELRMELEEANGQMRRSHKQITGNLLNAGYMLDDETLGLVSDL